MVEAMLDAGGELREESVDGVRGALRAQIRAGR
jgi:hypothetical protein